VQRTRFFASAVLLVTIVSCLAMSVATIGSASASVSPHKPAAGLVNCTGVAATVKFNPPLQPQGTKKETVKVTGVQETGCTDSSGPVTATKVSVAIKAKGATNSCSSFAAGTANDTITVTTKWSGGISPTKVVFKPGSVTVNSTANGFNASGGKASGSFATKTGASFDVQIADTSALVACIANSGTVVSLQINEGTAVA
jgi:hypothetical protein